MLLMPMGIGSKKGPLDCILQIFVFIFSMAGNLNRNKFVHVCAIRKQLLYIYSSPSDFCFLDYYMVLLTHSIIVRNTSLLLLTLFQGCLISKNSPKIWRLNPLLSNNLPINLTYTNVKLFSRCTDYDLVDFTC